MTTVVLPTTVENMREVPTVEMCLAGRDITEPRLSPDGLTVAMVVRDSGAPPRVVLVPADGGPERVLATAAPPTTGRGRNGGALCWLPDSSAVVHAVAGGGLWLQPVPSGVARRLAQFDGAVEGPSVSPDGATVVVSVDRGSIWTVSTAGEGRPRRLDDGRHDFCLDPTHLTVGATSSVVWQAWSAPQMAWDESVIVACGAEGDISTMVAGSGQVQQPRVLVDGSLAVLRDDNGWLNLWVDGIPVAEEHYEHGGPTWGPAQRSFVGSPCGELIAFTRNVRGFGQLCVLNRSDGSVIEVARGIHGQLHWAGNRLTALRSGARTPTQVVVYDTEGPPKDWSRKVLAVGPVSGWEELDLPEPDAHVAVGRDGTEVPFRRYAAGQGRAIVHIHGGPTDQWDVDFMPRIAYWCLRGWDIIVPDHRGSTGHGREYTQALRGGWGRDDVIDIRAVIEHVHQAGWTSPSQTLAMGSSSGGMAVLGLAASGAGYIAGGIALYPVSDPAALATAGHRYEAHYSLGLIGPEGDPAYAERSALTRAEQIDVPLLILHGTDDPVVPVSQSRDLAAAMVHSGRSVRFEEFPGEGHGFSRPENRRAEYRLVGEFLEEVRRGITVAGSSLSP